MNTKETIVVPRFPLPRGWYFGWRTPYSNELRDWQQRMSDRGWEIMVDGLYGSDTAMVAEAFQREKGLKADRKIGKDTWYAAWTEPIT